MLKHEQMSTLSRDDFSTSWKGAGSMCISVKLTIFSISCLSHSRCSSRFISGLRIFLPAPGDNKLSPKSQPELARLDRFLLNIW